MSSVIHGILGLPGWLVLVASGLVVFAEDALLVGFVFPGETVAVLAGAAAALGHVPLVGVLVVVIGAAVAGDTAGYWVGRRIGPRLLPTRPLQRRRAGIDDARLLLARRGGVAVLIGRWVAFLRPVVPAVAGVVRMPYRTFLVWNGVGATVWGTTVVLLGYTAGASYVRAERTLGRGVAVAGLAVALVVVGLVVRRVRARAGGVPSAEWRGCLSPGALAGEDDPAGDDDGAQADQPVEEHRRQRGRGRDPAGDHGQNHGRVHDPDASGQQ